MSSFFESAILILLLILLYLNENKQPVHMRYHLFLRYGWFLQNHGKEFIRTNMHTTVGGLDFVLILLYKLVTYIQFFKLPIYSLSILGALETLYIT